MDDEWSWTAKRANSNLPQPPPPPPDRLSMGTNSSFENGPASEDGYQVAEIRVAETRPKELAFAMAPPPFPKHGDDKSAGNKSADHDEVKSIRPRQLELVFDDRELIKLLNKNNKLALLLSIETVDQILTWKDTFKLLNEEFIDAYIINVKCKRILKANKYACLYCPLRGEVIRSVSKGNRREDIYLKLFQLFLFGRKYFNEHKSEYLPEEQTTAANGIQTQTS